MKDLEYFEDGIQVGRPESPGVEHAFQDAVKESLIELFETKGLYQNVTVTEHSAKFFLDNQVIFQEFRTRPLFLFSRGETEPGGGIPGHTGGGPLGTPNEKMDVGCYLPNINTYCSKCKTVTGFISHSISNAHYLSPYPIFGEETEQVYSPLYRCSKCRSELINFQVLRRGYRIQLTGRSRPYRPNLDREWPKHILEIVSDAASAVAENDIPAGYYHLRTAIEFYIKAELQLEPRTKIDGTELCDEYYKMLDDRLKTGFPSVSKMYSELSEGLHTRVVSSSDFDRMFRELLDHFKAKKLFDSYS